MTPFDPAARHVLEFLSALEREATPSELATYLHPEVRQREYPSLVKPWLAERALPEILAGSVAGRRLLARQHYDVDEVIVSGERVVIRLRWTGTLAVAFHGLEAGHELHAYVAMFVTLRDGLIAHQASYDCYESFDPARDRAPTATAVEQGHLQAPDASRVP